MSVEGTLGLLFRMGDAAASETTISGHLITN
jgi:hypothetical protein